MSIRFNIIISAVAFLLSFSEEVSGDSRIDVLIDSILSSDPQIKARKAQTIIDYNEVRTENQLEDPQVSFDHFWGTGSGLGRKYTVSIEQSFDWPSLYSFRSRYASAVKQTSEAEYAAFYREKSFALRSQIYEYIYNRLLLDLAEVSADIFKQTFRLAEEGSQLGEVTVIDLKKSRLQELSAQRKVRQARTALSEAYRKIVASNGGVPVDTILLNSLSLPEFENLLPLEAYMEAGLSSPSIIAKKSRLNADVLAVGMAKHQRLPKFALGYAFNNEFGDKFHGITGSITLPVYSRRSQMAVAKSKMATSENDLSTSLSGAALDVGLTFDRAVAIKNEAMNYDSELQLNSLLPSLNEALAAGIMTITEYLREVDYELSLREEMLEGRYEFATALNDLFLLSGL